jgi:hypothetical protein
MPSCEEAKRKGLPVGELERGKESENKKKRKRKETYEYEELSIQ